MAITKYQKNDAVKIYLWRQFMDSPGRIKIKGGIEDIETKQLIWYNDMRHMPEERWPKEIWK